MVRSSFCCFVLAANVAAAVAIPGGDPAAAEAACVAGVVGGIAQCDSAPAGDTDPASLLQSRVQRHGVAGGAWQGQTMTLQGPGAPLQTLPAIDTAASPVTLEVRQLQVCLPEELATSKSQSCFYTRAYGTPSIPPSIPGPTLLMTPGTDVHLTLENKLENPDPCPDTKNNPGLFCYPNSTNLHVHGLHVSPKNGSDSIWTEIEPGQSWDYHYWIPPYHMAGTFWYHPHRHHATSIQAGGGMAGAIVMEDPPNALPPQVQNMTELILVLTMINAAASSNNLIAGVWGNPALESMAQGNLWKYQNGKDVNLANQVVLINGQYKPSLAIESGKWYRLRMVYGAVWSVTTARILDMDGGSCEMQMLAKDGIYLNEAPRKISAAYFASGNRVDVALMCTCTGSKTCSTSMASADSITTPQVFSEGLNQKFLHEGAQQADQDGHMKGTWQPVIQQVLMTINIQPGLGDALALPSFSVTRPCYLVDLMNVEVPKSNQGRLELMNPVQFQINWAPSLKSGLAKGTPMNHMDQPAWTSLKVGEVYEYNFVGDPTKKGNWDEGTGLALHPLHTHVNPYQIIDLADASNGDDAFYQNGDWQDTLLWPGMSAVVKFQTDFFVGHMIAHCHLLGHEDQGMMGWFNITGREGTMWSGAKQVDPSCYREYGGAGYTLLEA